MNSLVMQLRSLGQVRHSICRAWMSDYSDNFRGKELADETRWIRKHEQEVASLQTDSVVEEVSESVSTYSPPRAATPGSILYAHQSIQVLALEELEEMLEAFPGRSADLPSDLKKLLVDWKVAALYESSTSEDPHEHAPTLSESGALVLEGKQVLPPEYAPEWLFEQDPLKYKFLRYAYEQMVHDHDIEHVNRHIDRKDPDFHTIKQRVLEKADPAHSCADPADTCAKPDDSCGPRRP